MYGLLNSGFRDFVVTTYTQEAWDRISVKAGVDGKDCYHPISQYPDEMLVGMISAAAEETQQPLDNVLKDFGRHWIEYTASHGYEPLYRYAGPKLEDFLQGLNEIHSKVSKSFPHLTPPQFKAVVVAPSTMRLSYISLRQGLCPMIPGLLEGLSIKFATPVTVQEDRCVKRGDPHCEFVLGFPSEP